jgi:hypothetical protein
VKDVVPIADMETFNKNMEKLRMKTVREMKKAELDQELRELESIRKEEEHKAIFATDEDPLKGPPLFHRVWRNVHP